MGNGHEDVTVNSRGVTLNVNRLIEASEASALARTRNGNVPANKGLPDTLPFEFITRPGGSVEL